MKKNYKDTHTFVKEREMKKYFACCPEFATQDIAYSIRVCYFI